MRAASGIALLVAVIAVGTAAAATPHVQQRIVPGVSIGKIKMGMTLAEVRKVLGAPESVITEEQRGFGRLYREYSWNLTEWRIGFDVQRGRARVVTIGTSTRAERTAEAIGPGTPQARLGKLRGYPCRTVWVPNTRSVIGSWCIGRAANGARTVFAIGSRCKVPRAYGMCRQNEYVHEVREVRLFAAGQPLPVAFAPAPDERP